MRLPPDEIERRRQASIEALKRQDQEAFNRWYQELCDRMRWASGPCCAGCDHWQSEMALIGFCTAGEIISGEDVLRSMGISFSSYTPPPGYPQTKADHKCGLFKDDFDWATMPPEYLTRIGAPKHFTADQEDTPNG